MWPQSYRVDPTDPRAPSAEVWASLSEAEREAVGWHLADHLARSYEPIVPQGGRWSSRVLEFSTMLDEALQRAEEQEAQRASEEAQRASEEAQRASEEAQRADRLAARLRELGVDPDSIE